eukprot:501139-Pelagomonas_calceolata.AAC.1
MGLPGSAPLYAGAAPGQNGSRGRVMRGIRGCWGSTKWVVMPAGVPGLAPLYPGGAAPGHNGAGR